MRRRMLLVPAVILGFFAVLPPVGAEEAGGVPGFSAVATHAQGQAATGYFFNVGNEENRLVGALSEIGTPPSTSTNVAALVQRGVAASFVYGMAGGGGPGKAGVLPEPPPGEAAAFFPAEPAESKYEGPVTAGAKGPVVGGQFVRLELAHHLQAVFQPAQEPIGAGQRLAVGRRYEAFLGQGRQRPQRIGIAKPFVAAAVHELEELHRELDVADATPTALDLDALLAKRTDAVLDRSSATPFLEEIDMLLPRDADHDEEVVRSGKVEQPARRNRIRADGVDVRLSHAPEIRSDNLWCRIIRPVDLRAEGAVSNAAEVQLLAVGEEELASRLHPGLQAGAAVAAERHFDSHLHA